MNEKLDPKEARQGQKGFGIRYVLGISLALAVVALIIVVIFAV